MNPKNTLFLVLILASLALPGGVFAQNYPFPQHVTYAAGIKPNNVSQSSMDSTVQSFWSAWSSRYIKAASTGGYYVAYNLEGQGDTGAATVSEAHGYGMVLCAYMGDKTHYDGMYTYYKHHPSQNNAYLMAWQQDTSFNDMNGADSATDGDMDIAYSLLVADKQWGSSGAINYRQAALNMINAIMQSDVNQSTWTLRLGDWATSGSSQGYAYSTATRPSDFMFDHLQSFLAATGDSRWTNVINKTATVVNSIYNNYSSTTGLIPDFVVYNGSSYRPAPANFLEASTDGEYAYNSCRTPWRFATDYMLRGTSPILSDIRATYSWIQGSSGGNPNHVWPGYTLSGSALDTSYTDDSFTSPFAVSAMTDSGNQSWLNSLWSWIAARGINTGDGYFGNSITMQCVIVLSGNWWSPTAAAAQTYTITASAGTGGTISPSGTVTVNQGASQTFTLSANSGYSISSVTVDGTNVGAVASYTFSNVQANHTINAAFSSQSGSNIAPNGTAYGWYGMSSSTATTNQNAQPGLNDGNLTTNVDLDPAGDSIGAWEGGGVIWSSAATISSVNFINGDITSGGDGFLTANLALQFTTDGTTWVNSGWTCSPAYPYSSSAGGHTYTFSGTAVSGVLGARVVGQVRTVDTSYHWILKEIQVTGTLGGSGTSYIITASAGTGGTISPSGNVTVNQGASQTFTLSADSGYTISSVSVDGANVGAVTSYTFSNVQANHTINAAFSASTGGLPSPWADADVGSPALAGSASYSSGTFTVNGGGTDIWGSSDQFHYVYQSISGDQTITAEVVSQQNTSSWAKSGVMFRASTAANDQFIDLFVTPGNGVGMQYRSAVGGTCTSISGTAGVVAPYWVRIVRSGTSFTGYSSANGSTWTQVGTITLSLPTSATAGLEVCAHTGTALNTSTFQNVTVNATNSNIAPSGTAYGWHGMSSSTATTNQTALPGLNDNNLTNNIDLDSAGDAIGAWEAAGVVWSTAHTLSSADFINGDITTGGDGYLTANLSLQYSTDGVTWQSTGWTISPAYPYSSSAGGQTYTASGATLTGVVGLRFVGQVRTTDTSYHWIVKEVQAIGQ